MRVIDRYIGKQLLFSTVFAVVMLTVVLVLGNILQKLMGQLVRSEIPLGTILESIGYLLPFSLVFTLPWGFLTSILLVFGRLSADNELVSLRMAGLSIARICVPVFVLAVVLSGVCFWINVSVAPKAEAALKQTIFRAVMANPLSLFSADQVTDIPGHQIYVEGKDGNELSGFRMVGYEEKRPNMFITAKKVEVSKSDDGKKLLMHMFDVHMQQSRAGMAGQSGDPTDKVTFIAREPWYEISLEEMISKSTRRRPSQMDTSELLALSKDPSESPENRSGFLLDVHKRYSFSMACLTLALIAVPLGITAQRRETSIGFVLSLAVAAVYFMFMIVADWFKKIPEAYPHLLVWLPNVVFLMLGGWLFWKLSKK